MIDFLKAHIFIGKDSVFFDYLDKISEYSNGWVYYTLKGCKDFDVRYNAESGWLEIKGSIMYFAQGHNFTYDEALFVSTIDYIGKMLKVDLWDMALDEVEFGIILKTTKPPKYYIKNHRPKKGLTQHESKNKDISKRWEDKWLYIKMYDAGRNIQHKQGNTMKGIIEEAGWNPSDYYLKVEVHYKKPEKALNHGYGIKLADMLKPKWKKAFGEDLIKQYERLIPMKTICKPKDKKELSTIDIFARELVESKINEGISIQEVKKAIYERINASALLSNADKDARKRMVKATLDKLEESESSEWDLKDMIQEELKNTTDPLYCEQKT